MFNARRIVVFFTLLFVSATAANAQHTFKDRDDALLYVSRTFKGAASSGIEGSAKLPYLYAMYVEDSRMVYVTASKYDTTYTVIPYEAIDLLDTVNGEKRYIYLYAKFGAFAGFQAGKEQGYNKSGAEVLMQDTARYDPVKLLHAFDYLGKKPGVDLSKRIFPHSDFFYLNAYRQLPRYPFYDSTAKQVSLNGLIKKANRPAMVITWAEWCPPCMKFFDSLYLSGISSDYSVILIKKGSKADMGKRLHVPGGFKWWSNMTFLFDHQSLTDALDQQTVPAIFFTDATGNIMREHTGFNLGMAAIKQLLDAIKQQKITAAAPQYYTFFHQPALNEKDGRIKYVTDRKGDRVDLLVFFRKFDTFEPVGKVQYTIDAIGELKPVQ